MHLLSSSTVADIVVVVVRTCGTSYEAAASTPSDIVPDSIE